MGVRKSVRLSSSSTVSRVLSPRLLTPHTNSPHGQTEVSSHSWIHTFSGSLPHALTHFCSCSPVSLSQFLSLPPLSCSLYLRALNLFYCFAPFHLHSFSCFFQSCVSQRDYNSPVLFFLSFFYDSILVFRSFFVLLTLLCHNGHLLLFSLLFWRAEKHHVRAPSKSLSPLSFPLSLALSDT